MLSTQSLMTFPTAVAIAATACSNAITCCQSDASPDALVGQFSMVPDPRVSHSFTGAPSWSTLDELRTLYTIKNAEKVFPFLNDGIATLLVRAEVAVRQYFDSAELAIELRSDPEGDRDTLLVSIITNLPWESAEDRLDRFDRSWWFSQSWLPSSKRICIDTRRS